MQMNFEGMRNLTSSVALAVAEAMKTKSVDKLHHHTEDVLLKTVGMFPGGGHGADKVRWVIKLERVLKANKVTNLQDVLRIAHRAILDPDITDKFNEAFLEAQETVFVNKDERPEFWRRNWHYPIYGDDGYANIWVARFILAMGVDQEIIKEIVSALSPTKQQAGESYDQLSKRIKTLKAMSMCAEELFPGDHKLHQVSAYDHYLLYDLQPELDDQVRQALALEERNRDFMQQVMRMNNTTINLPTQTADYDRLQIVRTVASRSKQKDEQVGNNLIPAIIDYIHNYVGDDNFESFRFKRGKPKDDEIRDLKERV